MSIVQCFIITTVIVEIYPLSGKIKKNKAVEAVAVVTVCHESERQQWKPHTNAKYILRSATHPSCFQCKLNSLKILEFFSILIKLKYYLQLLMGWKHNSIMEISRIYNLGYACVVNIFFCCIFVIDFLQLSILFLFLLFYAGSNGSWRWCPAVIVWKVGDTLDTWRENKCQTLKHCF